MSYDSYSPEKVMSSKKKSVSGSVLLSYPDDIYSNEEKKYVLFSIYKMEPFNYSSYSTVQQAAKTLNFESNEFTTVGDIILYIPGNSLKTSYKHSAQEGDIDTTSGRYAYSMAEHGLTGAQESAKQQAYGNIPVSDITKSRFDRLSNPRVELLYKSPSLRSHSFEFKFLPRNKRETELAKDIIYQFKWSSSPKLTEGEAFLEKPHVFEISFFDDTYLFKVKKSFLTSIDVDYAAEGVTSFFPDNAPSSISLNMTFDEIEYITRDDIEKGY